MRLEESIGSSRVSLPNFPSSILEPVAPSAPVAFIEEEIRSLPESRLLFRSAPYSVYYATGPQVPRILVELGRLRELTFRQVGEGTGKRLDLDEYDNWYLHLFVWNEEAREIVGAYRLCLTDRVYRSRGLHALYTRSLFEFDRTLLEALPPALELGRSFVRPEYQKTSLGLALLWRGIGQFVLRHPEYRTLVGPVSVPATYSEASRSLISAALSEAPHRHPLAHLVRSKHPLPATAELQPSDVRSLSRRISQLEPDGKALPTLVHQYVRLGGKFLGFSVDPDFQDALDGLVVVNLSEAPTRLLSVYVGTEGANQIQQNQGRAHAAGTAAA